MSKDRPPCGVELKVTCKTCGRQFPEDHLGRCPKCRDSVSLSAIIGEKSAIVDSTTLGAKDPNGKTVLILDTDFGNRRSKIADINGQHFEFSNTGKPAQNEEGALDACKALISHLNQSGAKWGTPYERRGPEDGIDCIAESSSGKLLMQVTRPVDQNVLKELAKNGTTTGQFMAEEIADQILATIQKKAAKETAQDRLKIVLVLDARHVPHALSNAVDHFLINHSAKIAGLGFQAVWLIGPMPDLIWQLDLPC